MDKYPAIIVVEGASDEALIRSFLDADIVITNGSDVPRETIEYLKKASKTRDIVVLTDPDSPGKRIRDVLDANIEGLQHAFVRKEKAIKKGKVGVAESSEEEIRQALSKAILSKGSPKGQLTMNDLYELGLSGSPSAKEKRLLLENRLQIGYGNGKRLLQRLNSLGISKEELIEALHD